MTTKQIREKIREHSLELNDLRQRYLHEHGWRYTSSTPGCLWLWVKDIPKYGPIWATEEMALSMQMDISCDECDESEEP